MDNDYKLILEKFEQTVEQLSGFKKAASKVFESISEIGMLASRIMQECSAVNSQITEHDDLQKTLLNSIMQLQEKIAGNSTLEKEFVEEIKILNKHFRGVVNLSKKLDAGLADVQSALEKQMQRNYDLSSRSTAMGGDYIISRLDELEKLSNITIQFLASKDGSTKDQIAEKFRTSSITEREIVEHINEMKNSAENATKKALILNSDEVHEAMKLQDKKPMVCRAMKATMGKEDKLLEERLKGYTESIIVEYKLKAQVTKKTTTAQSGKTNSSNK
ncbi:MAG: hypothetical protein LBE09_04970 [Christensenellaceae bacterium]|jgi:hypothetical protein|nr:hypothetical protein [Christensenellaceae bacterium]